MSSPSGEQRSAVDRQDDAGDIAASGAGEEYQRPVEFSRLAQPAYQCARNHRCVCAFIELAAHLGFEVSWRDRIDPDAFTAGPLLSQVSGQADHAGLARGVGGLRQAHTRERKNAADVDDRAAWLHHSRACLRHPVTGVEIEVDYGTELFGGFLQRGDSGAHASVVYQHVDPAERAHGRAREGGAVLRIGDVSPDGQTASAFGFHQPARLHEAVFTPGAEHDVRACLGEGPRELDSEPARRASHDRHAPVETEAIEYRDHPESSPRSCTAGPTPYSTRCWGRFIEASRALRSVPVPCWVVDRQLARRARPRRTRSRSLT